MEKESSDLSPEKEAGHVRGHVLDEAMLDSVAGGIGAGGAPESVKLVGGRCPYCGQDMFTKGTPGYGSHDTFYDSSTNEMVFYCEKADRYGRGIGWQ